MPNRDKGKEAAERERLPNRHRCSEKTGVIPRSSFDRSPALFPPHPYLDETDRNPA